MLVMIRPFARVARAQGAGADGASVELTDDVMAARREKLATMSVSEKRDFLQKKERFDELSEQEQERLRKLHAALQSHPNREELSHVLNAYTIWLSTLPQRERAELADLDPSERIKEIQKRTRRRHDRRLAEVGLYTPQDAHAVREWWGKAIETEGVKLAEAIPDEHARERVQQNLQHKDFGRRIGGVLELTHQLGLETVVGRVSHKSLIDQLSSDTLEGYFGQDNPDAKNALVASWITAVFRPRPIPREKLLEFAAQLPDSMQEELERLPPKEMYEQLQAIFHQRRWGRDGWRNDNRRRGGDRSRRGNGSWGRGDREEREDDRKDGRGRTGRDRRGRKEDDDREGPPRPGEYRPDGFRNGPPAGPPHGPVGHRGPREGSEDGPPRPDHRPPRLERPPAEVSDPSSDGPTTASSEASDKDATEEN